MSADPFREAARHLITSVALVTSTGKNGPDVMAAEWTFQVSYRPMMLIVIVSRSDATYENILETREFGANFAGDDQASLVNLAGNYTGKEVNKLTSDIFRTYAAKKIRAPMISGCFLNAECKVTQVMDPGDHAMFLGEVLEVQFDKEKSPLLYSQRRLWHRGAQVQRSTAIYTTITLRPGVLRVDGRLQGVEKHPQTVALSASSNNGDPILEETVETDEFGYFQFVRPNIEKAESVRSVKAEWNGLTATASPKNS